MSAASPVERIAARGAPPAAGGAAWTRRRQRALESLLAKGLPDRRDENWKYLDHARIAGFAFESAPQGDVNAGALGARLLPLGHARRVVLADGRFAPGLSDFGTAAGLEILDLAALLERDPDALLSLLRPPGDDPDDRYALLADAFATGGALLRVAARSGIAEPIYLVHIATAARPAVHQARIVIEAGAGARFTLVEHFISLGDAAALGNLAAEVTLGESADVTHVRLHQHGPEAAQVETCVVRLAARSRYAQHLLALGGKILRSTLRVALEGERAACRLDGLFLADGERQVDLVTQVAHRGAATETVQEYRGIAAGRGRGAFNGRIDVHATAKSANASQSSRNLLLTPLAEINVRPQLEIQVDDVQCRHGATIGSLDAEQLFYLESRGIDPVTARALLTFAFCRDLTGRLPFPALREAAEALVAGSLPDRDLIGGPG
jgi:Fe-S cluster assembly protein SufD